MTALVDAIDPARPVNVPARVVGVRAATFPFEYCHDRYQAYYAAALREAMAETGGRFESASPSAIPGVLGGLRRARHSWRLRHAMTLGAGRVIDSVGRRLSRFGRTPSGMFHPLVGQYVLTLSDGREFRLCIDAQDSGDVASPELLAWSELYLKTNYWSGRDYPGRVRPFFNANPLLLGHLDELRAMRRAPAEYDVCFFVRVWGGTDEVGGIEHILRLLEAVNRTDCRKFLMAYLVAGDIPAIARRLERQGIGWCTRPMPLPELWQLTARSRLNVIRLGMHGCVPWRMADLLALGACTVLDQPPLTRWPEPLTDGRHFVGLDAVTGLDRQHAVADDYDRIPERLARLLADEALVSGVRRDTAAYFDDHFAPAAMGRRICRMVENHASS